MELSEAYRSLVTEAHQYMTECQDRLRSEYQLDAWPRYDWGQESASLVFSDQSGPRVRASIQFVGSISTRTNTWLWSWANDSLMYQVTCLMSRVREYGKQNGIDRLAKDYWPANEVDGWEMTSVAGFILGAKGAYRTPDENGFIYMVIMDVGWIS